MCSKRLMARQTRKIALIGPGRLGQMLTRAMIAAGMPIVAIAARSNASKRLLRGLRVPVFDTPADAAARAQVVLITTRDDDVAGVVRSLVPNPAAVRGRVFLHCSGILTSSVLEPLHRQGAVVGSIHPLQTFAEPPPPVSIFKDTTFYFEGDEQAKAPARRIVRGIGARFRVLRAADKVPYHAAASIASNLLVASYDAAVELLQSCGFARREARLMLMPLASATLMNLKRLDTPQALTGPIVRGDASVVREHLAALKRRAPNILPLYMALARRALEIAERRGSDERLREIRRLLKG